MVPPMDRKHSNRGTSDYRIDANWQDIVTKGTRSASSTLMERGETSSRSGVKRKGKPNRKMVGQLGSVACPQRESERGGSVERIRKPFLWKVGGRRGAGLGAR